jgi:hypothetical protein
MKHENQSDDSIIKPTKQRNRNCQSSQNCTTRTFANIQLFTYSIQSITRRIRKALLSPQLIVDCNIGASLTIWRRSPKNNCRTYFLNVYAHPSSQTIAPTPPRRGSMRSASPAKISRSDGFVRRANSSDGKRGESTKRTGKTDESEFELGPGPARRSCGVRSIAVRDSVTAGSQPQLSLSMRENRSTELMCAHTLTTRLFSSNDSMDDVCAPLFGNSGTFSSMRRQGYGTLPRDHARRESCRTGAPFALTGGGGTSASRQRWRETERRRESECA